MNILINHPKLKQFMNYCPKFLIACLIVVLGSCSTRNLFDTAGAPKVTVDKNPLVLHKDSVLFTLRATIPAGLVSEKNTYTLLPEYQYGEGALPLEEIEVDASDLAASGTSVEIIEKMSFPYLEGMDRGELRVKGLLEEVESGKSFTTPYIQLAEGIVSTPKLVRVGQFAPGESIPEVGAYMAYDEAFLNMAAYESAYYFSKNSAQINPSESNDAFKEELESVAAKGEPINTILIQGMASPDESSYIKLSSQRAQAIESYLKDQLKKAGYQGNVNAITFEMSQKEPDWLLFRHLLRTFNKIDMTEKDKYFDIIYGDASYEEKVNAIKELPSYKIFSRDKFDQMQLAQVAFMMAKDRRPDPEISGLANLYINGTAQGDELTEAELARAAEFNPGLKEKQILYEAMISKHGSALAYNNLGVVYLNQAHRMIKVSDKNNKVTEAMNLFRMSNDINESAAARHNMGQAYLMREDYGAAYIEISEASALSKDNPEFNSFNEGKRGAIDIIRGDYKLATLRLKEAPETATNLFNKGLAFYLAEEYAQAAVAFEESALSNMEFGYAFYGLALVAAQNRDEERLYENLQKAVQRSPYLKRRAATDMEFKDYFQEAEYREAIR
ncbi:hypothetical protein IFO69_14650 [Echinicola sp. CAU 1574]|uniref:Tetratricopeptide repeat protein n=2 Tax=Echinicola arenosa TaxID=2774144 RepID=A0ABR9AQV4_9BACT|nr:hypothetical protein [Echinicola arenosa]